MSQVNVVVLAAGKGTRMRQSGPKVLATALERPLLGWVLNSVEQAGIAADRTHVVVGYQRELVSSYLSEQFPGIHTCVQAEQNGTAHAVQCYFDQTGGSSEAEWTIIMCGDAPLVQSSTLVALMQEVKTRDLDALGASFHPACPTGFGRIKRLGSGVAIVEEKEASVEEKLITEVNSGLYVMKTSKLIQWLGAVDNQNNSGEFYLTDVFQSDRPCSMLDFGSTPEFAGVNTQKQLAEVEDVLRIRVIDAHMENGVRIQMPQTCSIGPSVKIAPGSSIGAGTLISGQTVLEEGASVGAYCVIEDSHIGPKADVRAHSVLESARMDQDSMAGPFARLRPQAHLESEVKVGNFVEIKKATLRAGAKASHLSYIGDADIGERTNIGCGFVTCNYDGVNKHKTVIGKDCFIGSDCQTVAPVTIGDDCFVAAGSTVTQSIESGDFAIARSRQNTRSGLAKKFLPPKED